ncbi:hypothetical protein Tco_0225293 [Tanacetum coccineum]
MEQTSRIREQTILRAKDDLGRGTSKERLLPDKERDVKYERTCMAGFWGTAIPRFVMEHLLKAYPLAKSVVHMRRPLTPDRIQALREKMASGAWQVQVDYSSFNRVCAKDIYPFPDIEEELGSLMGYPYKCFLLLLKENSQIRMVEDDEEKTGLHTEEGV